MSGNMPELGSKISLISKADIRYEGRLFTVDPNECTIALANVRSFGTEDRETQFPIAAQNQVYDYILFRGSDIKDIRVCNSAPIPNDPAIMQMHLPQMGQQPFQPPHFPMALGHPMGGPPQMGQFGPYGMPMGAAVGAPGGQGMAPGQSMPGLPTGGMQKQKPSELNVAIPEPADFNKGASMLEFIGGGSRSTTPQSLSRKSPTMDMGVQVNQPIGRNDANKRVADKSGGNASQNPNRSNNQRERRDSGKNAVANNQENLPQGAEKAKQYQNKKPQSSQLPSQPGGQNVQNNQQQQQQRGWIQRGGQMRGGRGGRMNRGGPNQAFFWQNFRQQGNTGGGPNAKARGGKSIKFDSDYDFEQANSKFEELRSQLAKLKVGEEAKPEQQVNGESDKKDDSGNETGAGEQEVEEDADICVGYDKTKSFFDNISCEAATDRSKGKNRTDWRQERKLNSETFGVSSTRRGGFRGRGGGFYNRGPNMGMGGGYRGNFRSNNYRGNRNMRQSGGNQSTGIPQKQGNSQQSQAASSAAPSAAQ
ncbi:protein LSM14 homolog car-1 isoform X2 [Phlebotomus argentipes]|uniref:protein LSM14 homolog car-1 isoform X2 n=1 Tax=Phlebotomus argentipes TaxID=94469 RepID=UPI00289367B2|nr:protein LSM14 homolog car-1 isoform X2 [Phlebotomus argentipes]